MKEGRLRAVIAILLGSVSVWGFSLLLSSRATASTRALPTLTVVGTWSGAEETSFLAVLDEFYNRTGISTTYELSANVEDRLLGCSALSTCPDVAMAPWPRILTGLENQGAIVSLTSIITNFDTYYTTTWRNIGSVDGRLYAVPFKARTKSIIWYRPQAFNSISVAVPLTWTALLSVSDALVANGQTPFAIGAESGGATGWPLSDWFENILTRVAGPEVHRKLVNHDIAWTDPSVVATMQRFNDIVGRNDYQVGGITGTLTTNFYNAIDLVFGSPPSATMYYGAGWVQGVISSNYPSLIPGVDYNLFEFPEIYPSFGRPVVGGADLAVLFHDTSEARSLIQFLASPDSFQVWLANNGGDVSPNSGVGLSAYPDDLKKAQALQLRQAPDFVFDLDDQLPSGLQTYEWSALMDYVAHPDQMMTILQGIEDTATELQGPPYQLFLPAIMK